MYVQLPNDASAMMNVVSSTIINAMPSSPTVKRVPHEGIQCTSNTNCQPAPLGLNVHHSPNETMNSTKKVMSASTRGVAATPLTTSSTLTRGSATSATTVEPSAETASGDAPPCRPPPSAPCAQIAIAPSSGIARSTGSAQT